MSSSFSSVPMSPDASVAEQSRKEMQAKLNGLGGISGKNMSPELKAKKLREACEGFESIFIQKMWQEMRNTVPKGGMTHGKEERFWQDMYDQELSKSMTSAGGIGLADMMYEQLSRNLVSASRGTASQVSGAIFTPAAAPLVSPANMVENAATPVAGEMTNSATAAKAMPSIYDGEAPQNDASHNDSENTAQEKPMAEGHPVQAPYQKPAPEITEREAARIAAAEAREERRQARRAKSAASRDKGNSGLDLAYMARRDAGDKLGARAVRPALHKRPERVEKHEPVSNPQPMATFLSQSGNLTPGTAEGLRAALELAKSGAQAEKSANAPQLHNIVASVQAQNAANAVQSASVQPAASTQAPVAAESASTEPVVRKVRYTTNIPTKNRSSKKGGDAIRLLNADNVGVNSKAGKGLAAYHAAQEASQQSRPETSAAMNQDTPQPAAQPISPLTAQSAQNSRQGDASFAIPPLRSGDLKS